MLNNFSVELGRKGKKKENWTLLKARHHLSSTLPWEREFVSGLRPNPGKLLGPGVPRSRYCRIQCDREGHEGCWTSPFDLEGINSCQYITIIRAKWTERIYLAVTWNWLGYEDQEKDGKTSSWQDTKLRLVLWEQPCENPAEAGWSWCVW